MIPEEREDIKHVFICGAKSIGQYGGYETFVDKLSEYMQDQNDIKLHIICKANGEGCMDETRLQGARLTGPNEFEYHNAHCIKLPVPDIGHATAIYYDRSAVMWCIGYCRRHRIKHPVIYILTCRIGPFTPLLKRRIKSIGGRLHLNPDGHEWMRDKWPVPVRKYWKISERMMVKQADLVICDSKNIERYIKEEYRKYRPETTYIAYGAETGPSVLSDDDSSFAAWMQNNGVSPGSYYLAVGRFVPENNYRTMIREFLRSDTARDLVIITGENGKLYSQLERELHFSTDKRVKFAGTVYEQSLLRKIRENAFAYIHGHEVGGTNPSLLEGLGATDVNLLFDVGFNREVGEDAAMYWTKEEGNLSALIQSAERMTEEERELMGKKARTRIATAFSWEYISKQYSDLWGGGCR